jgi:hypothetical protein
MESMTLESPVTEETPFKISINITLYDKNKTKFLS